MSIPSHSANQNNHHRPAAAAMEDCRDYLRTGRCKYGASCKYNHPPNVQSGGGLLMNQPQDPNEPLFPHRPNEPACQYYLKHGTCKFGQACKFNHPPLAGNQSSASTTTSTTNTTTIHATNLASASSSSSSVQIISSNGSAGVVSGTPIQLMNLSGNKRDAAPLMLSPVDHQGMMLQFLPQRPDEPDCIYFLKNGRCKYGATCRYHHPIQQQQQQQQVRRIDATTTKAPRSRNSQGDSYRNGAGGQKVQYVTQMVPSYAAAVTHHHHHPQGSMILSTESNPVTFLNADGSSAPVQGYQIIHGSDGSSFCVPTGSVVLTEQTSSASSIASSYETAQEQQQPESAWNRARRNGSGSSLNAYANGDRQRMAFLPHSVSEGNIQQQQQRRARAASHGSASDHGASYFDASGSSTAVAGLTRISSAGSWTQRVQGIQHFSASNSNNNNNDGVGRPPGANMQRRHPGMRRSARGEGSDEGFTMMTSALLNMLDTTEEGGGEDYSDEEFRPRRGLDPDIFAQMNLPDNRPTRLQRHGEAPSYVDPVMFEQLSLHGAGMSASQLSPPSASRGRGNDSWSPTWQGSNTNSQDDGVDASFRMLHQGRHESAPSPHDPDIGLYLP